MSFGMHMRRVLRQRADDYLSTKDDQRAAMFDKLERDFKVQRERIAATLNASGKRINEARWGTPDGSGFFEITKHGTTVTSNPIRRPYQEQQP